MNSNDRNWENSAALASTWSLLNIEGIAKAADYVFPIERLSPKSLAYIGDAVYELYVRLGYLFPPKKIGDYHKCVVNKVRAESQAEYLQKLEPYLTVKEKEIVRKGRNATSYVPKRLSPSVYQQATALETLIGYLYLQNPQRLHELLAIKQ